MSAPYAKLPKWVDYGLIPLINLAVAFLLSGLVVLLAGESPVRAAGLLIQGAFGYGEGIGFIAGCLTSEVKAKPMLAVSA